MIHEMHRSLVVVICIFITLLLIFLNTYYNGGGFCKNTIRTIQHSVNIGGGLRENIGAPENFLKSGPN